MYTTNPQETVREIDRLMTSVRNYSNPFKVRSDVANLLVHLPNLKVPLSQQKGNILVPVISLVGTIPIQYKGGSYNIPIKVIIPEQYPLIPPTIFVVPTSHMIITQNHPQVDMQGKCMFRELQTWNAKFEISMLVKIMTEAFSKNPPVRTIPSQPSPPYQPGSPGAKVETVSQPPPPYNAPYMTNAYPNPTYPPQSVNPFQPSSINSPHKILKDIAFRCLSNNPIERPSLIELINTDINMEPFSTDIVANNPEELGSYKGYLDFSKQKPTKTCIECVLELSKEKSYHPFEFIVRECKKNLESRAEQHLLNEDELFSLVIYTWSLGFPYKPEENFYVILNNMLRERKDELIQKWSGYLFYLQNALSKLPNYSTEAKVVYRGIPKSKELSEYKLGRKIYWSGYTSTTTNIQKAIGFAKKDGIILKIRIINGKDISSFSVFSQESEILLSPNMCLIVSKPLKFKSKHGIEVIELFEDPKEKAFVF